jgi:putative acetyltransferase
MLIRQEHNGDLAAITSVTTRSFTDVEHSDQTESKIVERLRAPSDLAVSLVAVKDYMVVGHVAFSPIAVAGANDGWFGLGPVSVVPDHHGRGIGSALIRAGLEQLRYRDAAGCVVLGNPDYYRRFGFERTDRLRYEGAPPEHFMCLVLTTNNPPSGRVTDAQAFARLPRTDSFARPGRQSACTSSKSSRPRQGHRISLATCRSFAI